MVELERINGSTPSTTQKFKSPIEMDTTIGLLDLEGDRERIAAQAALNVAELSGNFVHPSLRKECSLNVVSISVSCFAFFCSGNCSFFTPN